ncbi:hypothetical protein SRHO_G00318090 [Serrasalmus rhombeus]
MQQSRQRAGEIQIQKQTTPRGRAKMQILDKLNKLEIQDSQCLRDWRQGAWRGYILPLHFSLAWRKCQKKAKLSNSLFSIFLAITRAFEKIIACVSSGMQPAPGRSQSAVIELPNHIIRAGLH